MINETCNDFAEDLLHTHQHECKSFTGCVSGQTSNLSRASICFGWESLGPWSLVLCGGRFIQCNCSLHYLSLVEKHIQFKQAIAFLYIVSNFGHDRVLNEYCLITNNSRIRSSRIFD